MLLGVVRLGGMLLVVMLHFTTPPQKLQIRFLKAKVKINHNSYLPL
jgi:hypothetical protein